MSDEEHDARHDLLVYIQTKLDDYQWATVKAFHDQVNRNITITNQTNIHVCQTS